MSVTVGQVLAFVLGVCVGAAWMAGAMWTGRRLRQQQGPLAPLALWMDEREEYDRRLAEVRAGHRRGLARMRQEHERDRGTW